MQQSLIARYISYTLISVIPTAVMADTIASNIPNGYFAPLTVIEDHPQCNGPGQAAFEVSFETADLSYEAQHVDGRQTASVSADGVVTSDASRCFVTNRRGTERIQVEVNCDDGAKRHSPFETYDTSQNALSVSGSFTACQSPFAFELLDSWWRVQSGGLRGTTERTGSVFRIPHQGCQGAGPVSGPQLYLEYVKPTMNGIATFRNDRFPHDDLDIVAQAPPTFFRLFLDRMPIFPDETGAPRAVAQTQVFLFPTDQGVGPCYGGVCRLPRLDRNLLNVRPARQCR